MSGFDNEVMNAINWDYRGVQPVVAQVTAAGQLPVGTGASPAIEVGSITSPLGTLAIGYTNPNITIDLAGGGTGIDSIALQAGTTPCVPDAAGLITFNGAVVAAGSTPVQTNGTAINKMTLEVQISQAVAATDATAIGMSAFDSTSFDVDVNGFVTFVGNVPQIITMTFLTHADSTYTVLSTDYYMSCDVSGGVLVIDLPDAPTTGRVFIVKDSTGSSAVSNITVTTVSGAVTIDGATTFVMNTAYEAANFVFNGTSYEIY